MDVEDVIIGISILLLCISPMVLHAISKDGQKMDHCIESGMEYIDGNCINPQP